MWERQREREQRVLGSSSSPPRRGAPAGDGEQTTARGGRGVRPVKPRGRAAGPGRGGRPACRPWVGGGGRGSPCRRGRGCGTCAGKAGRSSLRRGPSPRLRRAAPGLLRHLGASTAPARRQPQAEGFRCCQGLLHTRVTQPRRFGEAGDRGQPHGGAPAAASPPPQSRPRPLWGKARPRGRAARWQRLEAEGPCVPWGCPRRPRGLPMPAGSCERRDCSAARPGEEGKKRNGL